MEKKAAVYILLGQSNAVGHNIPMAAEDRITEPMKNVFGLHREHNQSYHSTRLTWSGYTSGGMNLAEEQDHTYSVANCLARLWQDRLDGGEDLPDLYIIQIAIGAQGVSEKYMWHPDRAEQLLPGKLGTVNISLFPFSMHIFSLLDDSFRQMGKEYEIIGLHWRGGSNDTTEDMADLQAKLPSIYRRLLDGFNAALHTPPTWLHLLICKDRCYDLDPTGEKYKRMLYINSVFEDMAREYPNVRLFDPRNAPQYIPDVRGNGVFKADNVHFTPEVNRWVAQWTIENYLKNKKGAPR